MRLIADELERAGSPCTTLSVEDPECTTQSGYPPAAPEIGCCVLEGAPAMGGTPVASRILVFEGDEHIESLRAQSAALPVPVVYGDTWEIFVEPPGRAPAIRDALADLDARLIR